MKALPLEQIGRQIVRASKSLTPEQRKTLSFDAVMMRLRIPVGALPRIGK
jgi:hypothetical protein